MQPSWCHWPAVTPPQHSPAVGNTKCPLALLVTLHTGPAPHQHLQPKPVLNMEKIQQCGAVHGGDSTAPLPARPPLKNAPSHAEGQFPSPFPRSLGFQEEYAGSCEGKGSTACSSSLLSSSRGSAGPVPGQAELRLCKTANLFLCRILPGHGCILQSPRAPKQTMGGGRSAALPAPPPRTRTFVPAVRQALVQAPAGALGDELRQVLEVEDEHDDDAFLIFHRHHIHQAAETRRCRAKTCSGGLHRRL